MELLSLISTLPKEKWEQVEEKVYKTYQRGTLSGGKSIISRQSFINVRSFLSFFNCTITRPQHALENKAQPVVQKDLPQIH